ncbi:MAG: hypothetical protein KDN05_23835, partial [Verrucomicrobiae bacterium]|nr:hypothetical protein [Verrucomicrobiae bacterium]
MSHFTKPFHTAVLAAFVVASSVQAQTHTPYTVDPDTFLLLHLDEAAGQATVAYGGNATGITGAYTVNNGGTQVTDVTGATGYFGNAANLSVGGLFSPAS